MSMSVYEDTCARPNLIRAIHQDPPPKRKPPEPVNARPDLARTIYELRRPLRVGRLRECLDAISTLTHEERKTKKRVRESAWRHLNKPRHEPVDPTKFAAVVMRPGIAVKPSDFLKAMRPGLPHNMTDDNILSRSRIANACLARAIIYYVMKDGLGYSYLGIGRRFGVDHTTALSAVRRIRHMIATGELVDPMPFLLPGRDA